VILLALAAAGCDYHANAFDPQVQAPARQESSPDADIGSGDADGGGPEDGAGNGLLDAWVEEGTADHGGAADTVSGCTEPEALNYNPAATADDGSCLFNVTVTFNLDMQCAIAVGTPCVAGGDTFGMPCDNPMSDEDGDGVWTVAVELYPGLATYYTFTSDCCLDWSCKENIAGQECAVAEHYNDRHLTVDTEDMVVNACFGQCGEGPCAGCGKGG
jgi:hypothetical protein